MTNLCAEIFIIWNKNTIHLRLRTKINVRNCEMDGILLSKRLFGTWNLIKLFQFGNTNVEFFAL